MVVALAMLSLSIQAGRLSELKVEMIDQAVREWHSAPIIEINVRTRCNKDETALFSNTWQGTEAGCFHYGVFQEDWVDTVTENNEYNARVAKEENKRRCSRILALDPIV